MSTKDESNNGADHNLPITVHTSRGVATFSRTGPRSASLSVTNWTPPLREAIRGENVSEAVQALCREEIRVNVETFAELHDALMHTLSHEGRSIMLHTQSTWSLERAWRKEGDDLTIKGGRFRVMSNLRFDQSDTADAALASAEIQNILDARIKGLTDLYGTIAKDGRKNDK